jgi:two-component system, cell cycle response regulator DivK
MDTQHALIIDDDAYNVYVMERFLDKENISYTTFTETSQLETILKQCEKANIVLLDLEMPNKDGYEIIQILKKHLDARVPIIACTVHTAEINRAKKIGFSGFIAKPLNMERFSEQISRILRGEAVWEAR